MELFKLEHQKLWRKRSVRLCVLLCYVYVVIVGNILVFQWFGFGTSGDYTSSFGNNFDGYTAIRDRQKYARSFGGKLTDETNIYKTMITYADPDRLTDFYGRRMQTIDEFLNISGQTGAEKEYLYRLEQKVKKPFDYQWVEGWSQLLGSMVSELGIVMALVLAVMLSALFSGEWHDNTSALILTTRNGREKIAFAKILTGLVFTVELFVLLAVSNIGAQLFFMGTSGWDMPIQNIKLIAVAPMNMLQAEIYEYMFTLLGAIGFAGIAMLISASVKSNVFGIAA